MEISVGQKHSASSQEGPWVTDPTVYPVEAKVGEDILQTWILELLRPLVERWFRLLGKPTLVGADQFIYYEQFDPHKVVAPDLYVLPGVAPDHRVTSWKVWETGVVPSFALEVVSSRDWEKDYREAVQRYADLGVGELIVFDPDHHRDRDRVRWQRYAQRKGRGLVQIEVTNGDRVRSRVLGCHMRVVGVGSAMRLRLGRGPKGDELVPTAEEEEHAARLEEHAARLEALARVAELEALLAKKKGAGRRRG
jgi:Putative restriction endonuclease